jgi:hypothetical protein
MFEFIYTVSVFTHFNVYVQFKWINKLHRILEKGCMMFATSHGIGTWSWWLPDEPQDLQKNDFIYKTGNNKKGHLRAQHHESHHTR